MAKRRKKRRRRYRLRPWVKISLVVIAVITLFCLIFMRNRLVKKVTIEAGDNVPAVESFLKKQYKNYELLTDLSDITTDHEDKYKVKVKVGWLTYQSTLVVKDTIAPTATAVNQKIKNGTTLEASAFVKDIKDATAVTVSFKSKPKFSKNGEYSLDIILEDEGHNKTTLTASLIVADDIEAPVITGAKDLSVKVGDKVSYKADVTVTDDQDTDITLNVDSSKVDLTTPGTYPVIYTATDAAGNETSETVNITVEEVSEKEEYVEEEAEKILEKLITDDMDDMHKLYAIWYYVHHNISYVGTSDKSDVITGAYDAIHDGVGDCYNYYALSEVLLNAAGYETKPVMRKDGHHFWNLVKIDSGWYHFDACVHDKDYASYKTFMLTDAEAAAYGEKVGRSDYYDFDPATVPATPTEPLKWNEQVN